MLPRPAVDTSQPAPPPIQITQAPLSTSMPAAVSSAGTSAPIPTTNSTTFGVVTSPILLVRPPVPPYPGHASDAPPSLYAMHTPLDRPHSLSPTVLAHRRRRLILNYIARFILIIVVTGIIIFAIAKNTSRWYVWAIWIIVVAVVLSATQVRALVRELAFSKGLDRTDAAPSRPSMSGPAILVLDNPSAASIDPLPSYGEARGLPPAYIPSPPSHVQPPQ